MKFGVCRYTDYTENFEKSSNKFMSENRIYQRNILSITSTQARTILWYWGPIKDE